ncbi:MAG: phosphate signaling complex protein PhoU [Candidatus Omnitrophica bacterium]|nr:phosphate signaling complex protein PhoU [Candidatus Omnitrophota bacterium]
MLEERITLLKKEITEFAALVDGMIEKATQGLLRREKENLATILSEDEPKANEFEIRLDEHCTVLIAQNQPAASDLRTILMIAKMSKDLERMGDHAVNIAESGLYLIERPAVKPLLDIPKMAQETAKMLGDSIEAFINEDVRLAQEVCRRDNVVDDLRDQIYRELITYMVSDSTTIERSLHLMRIASNLERIADLSTNIGEDVIFMVEGRVIKHHKEEKK